VYGATDAQAAYVKDGPVSPEDLLATIYHAMGLPPDSEVRDREDRPHRISDGRPVTALFG
jgi:arylsulfatase A-like enzyme